MDLLTGQMALRNLIVNFKRNTLRIGEENLSSGVIDGRVSLLDRYWSKFQIQHEALFADQSLHGNAYFTEDVYALTEVEYSAVLGYLLDEQARRMLEPRGPSDQPGGTSLRAQLPKISIPSFTGNQRDWESFRDLFQALIHRDPRLTAVEKFYYLWTAVLGEARLAIESLPLTESNYLTAWNLLLARFDNKKIRTHEHLKAIVAITADRRENVQTLQRNLDELTRHRDALQTLGCPVEHWDDWLVFFGSRSMDDITRRDWEKELGHSEENPTFLQWSAFMANRIQTLKALEPSSNPSASKDRDSRGPAPPSKRVKTLAIASSSSRTACPCCAADHLLNQCNAFRDLEPHDRLRVVRESERCFNCLRSGHSSKTCTSKGRCVTCGRRHHSLLHGSGFAKRQSGSRLDSDRP